MRGPEPCAHANKVDRNNRIKLAITMISANSIRFLGRIQIWGSQEGFRRWIRGIIQTAKLYIFRTSKKWLRRPKPEVVGLRIVQFRIAYLAEIVLWITPAATRTSTFCLTAAILQVRRVASRCPIKNRRQRRKRDRRIDRPSYSHL